jgi:hypothetical protein
MAGWSGVKETRMYPRSAPVNEDYFEFYERRFSPSFIGWIINLPGGRPDFDIDPLRIL